MENDIIGLKTKENKRARVVFMAKKQPRPHFGMDATAAAG
jgi:hypothetical protein